MKKTTVPGKPKWRARCRHNYLALMLLLPWLLAGCTRPTRPAWLGGTAPLATPPPVVATTTLEVWHWPGTVQEDAHLQELLADFQQDQPTIAINLVQPAGYSRRLRTALGNDRPPDVLYLNSYQLPDLVADGALAPLPPTVDRDLYSHLQSAVQNEGTTYCRPHSFHLLALFYNQQLFDAAALPYPDATWQWADLQSAAATLTDVEQGRFGLVLAADLSRWLAFLHQAGGSIRSADGSTMALNRPEGAVALDFYTNLVLEGVATTPLTLDSSWPGAAFGQGRAAMVIEGGWLIPHLAAQAPDVVYGVAPLPAGPAGKATISFGTCYAITALSPHQAAAQSLIDYLTAPEQLASWITIDSALPAQSSLQAAWRAAHPEQEALLDGVAVAIEWQLPAGFQPWVAAVNEQLRRVFGGFIPASAVLPEAEQRGNALLPSQAGLATD